MITYHQGEDEVPSLEEHFALGESGALPTGHLGHWVIIVQDVYQLMMYTLNKFMNTH